MHRKILWVTFAVALLSILLILPVQAKAYDSSNTSNLNPAVHKAIAPTMPQNPQATGTTRNDRPVITESSGSSEKPMLHKPDEGTYNPSHDKIIIWRANQPSQTGPVNDNNQSINENPNPSHDKIIIWKAHQSDQLPAPPSHPTVKPTSSE